MYPIIIKREPQKIRYHKEFELDGEGLTLAKLREYVTEDEIFSISETDESIHSKTMLYVNGTRLETKEETELRVQKEESYMKNYAEFHKILNKM